MIKIENVANESVRITMWIDTKVPGCRQLPVEDSTTLLPGESITFGSHEPGTTLRAEPLENPEVARESLDSAEPAEVFGPAEYLFLALGLIFIGVIVAYWLR